MAPLIQRVYGGIRYLDGLGPSLRNVEKLDSGAMPMLYSMQQTGMIVDIDHFKVMQKILREDMDRIIEKVHTDTGHYVNLGSGDQVADLLFKRLGIKQIRPKMTSSGDRESVAYEVLVGVQHEHPVVSDCIEYKEVEKLHGTYARPIPKLAKKDAQGNFRLHPNFTSTRIPSARYATKDPNLLAMPNKTERAKELCRGFIPKPGWVYLSVDLSQIEPRVVAHRSRDPKLCKIYENGEDIYSDFAIASFGIPDKRFKCSPGACPDHKQDHAAGGWHYPGVHKTEQRFPSKTCILASIYDVTGAGLAEQMPVICANCNVESRKHMGGRCGTFVSRWHEDNCQDMINRFYMEYERITEMRKQDHARARKHTLVWDDWGRILHTTAVRSVHSWVVAAALRELGNFPIQSTAMGCLKLAMAKVYDVFKEWGLLGDIYNPLLPAHDELLGECREDYAQEVGQYIKEIFESVVRLRIPVKAEMAIADSWGAMSK